MGQGSGTGQPEGTRQEPSPAAMSTLRVICMDSILFAGLIVTRTLGCNLLV